MLRPLRRRYYRLIYWLMDQGVLDWPVWGLGDRQHWRTFSLWPRVRDRRVSADVWRRLEPKG